MVQELGRSLGGRSRTLRSQTVDGVKLGQASLRLDAVYCAAAAIFITAVAFPLANTAGVHPGLSLAVAGMVAVWAAWLWRAHRRAGLVPVLRLVLGANVVASGVLLALGLAAPSRLLALVIVAAAVEVGAFAVSQAVALVRMA